MKRSRSAEKRAGFLLSDELVVDRSNYGAVWLFHVLLAFPRKCEDAQARSVMHQASNEATPQTDEMYSGCRDKDRLTGLSGSG